MPLSPPRPIPLSPMRLGRVAGEKPKAGESSPRPPGTGSRAAPAALALGLSVEALDPAAAAAHRDAWVDLMGRALEPNVFLDPDFVLPAARHLGARRRLTLVLVWAEGVAGARDLVAVCPVVAAPDPLRALASVWMHDLSPLGVPLLDRGRAGEALRALLLWAARGLPGARGLVIPSLPADGPTAALLREVAGDAGLALAELNRWERAVLRRGSAEAGLAALSSKGAKEVRRQGRRLAETGTVGYASVREGDALGDAVERFLSLEARGWKGDAGTALLASPGRTAFARAVTRRLGVRALCRVDSLLLDGEPIATALTLRAGDTEFLWKIAYREDVARLSPGVQLVLRITEAQRGGGGAALTDSCAVPGHPMIDRLWRDRRALCDLAVATRPGPGFTVAVAAERTGRRIRSTAKRAVQAWRARRRRQSPAKARAGSPPH